MELFEALLAQEQVSIERFVRFRIDSLADAEDILQETYLAAYQKFSQLRNPDAFKAWVLSIARNKCTDYFRQKPFGRKPPSRLLRNRQTAAMAHPIQLPSGKPSTHLGKRTSKFCISSFGRS